MHFSAPSFIISCTFCFYLLAMLAIGVIAYRRTANLSDYILAGRRLGPLVTALSAGASDMSGWLLLGLPGYAYAAGFEAIWIALGLLVGTYINWRLLAARLRSYSRLAGDAQTLSDFLEQRFHDSTRLLRILSGIFILLFFTFYTSSGLVAGGKLFNAVFGWPYLWAVLAGTLTIIVYTFLGGFFAVSWTDTVQATLMCGALVAVPLTAISVSGGWPEVINNVSATNPALLNPFTDDAGKTLSLVGILSLLGWGLGYFGQPHILARFMAINCPSRLPTARRIAMTWVTISMTGALLVGFTGIVTLPDTLTGAETEKIFINLVELLFHPVLAGVWLAAILAAIMSTADSQLLVASAALTHDFYQIVIRKEATQKELLWVGRFGVAGIAAAAFMLALNPDSKVLDLVAYAWAGFGAAFGPTLILALFWRRMTKNGAATGILTGGLTVILWKQLHGGIFDMYEIIPGFIFSALAIVAASLLSPAPEPKILAQFDQVRRNDIHATGGC